MSNNTNTQLAEDLAGLEQEYKDDLLALHQAEQEMRNAHDWLNKMIANANMSAKVLSEFKKRMQHD